MTTNSNVKTVEKLYVNRIKQTKYRDIVFAAFAKGRTRQDMAKRALCLVAGSGAQLPQAIEKGYKGARIFVADRQKDTLIKAMREFGPKDTLFYHGCIGNLAQSMAEKGIKNIDFELDMTGYICDSYLELAESILVSGAVQSGARLNFAWLSMRDPLLYDYLTSHYAATISKTRALYSGKTEKKIAETMLLKDLRRKYLLNFLNKIGRKLDTPLRFRIIESGDYFNNSMVKSGRPGGSAMSFAMFESY